VKNIYKGMSKGGHNDPPTTPQPPPPTARGSAISGLRRFKVRMLTASGNSLLPMEIAVENYNVGDFVILRPERKARFTRADFIKMQMAINNLKSKQQYLIIPGNIEVCEFDEIKEDDNA